MGVEIGVKRKSKNNSETPIKLRKTNGVGNQKTPKRSHTPAKNRQTSQKINTNRSPKIFTKKQKTPLKRNKQITEAQEEEEQSEIKYEGNWKVESIMNEEFSGKKNDLEDSEVSYGAVNQKTTNKSRNTPSKKQQAPQKINANKPPKTSQKKNRNIPEEDEEQSENEREGHVEVNLNEESVSDEENLEDTKVANDDEQGSKSDEDENKKEEDEQKDSDKEVLVQRSPTKQTHLDRTKFSVYVSGLRGADFQVPDIFKDCNYTMYTMLKDYKTGKSIGSAFVNFDKEENYKKALEKNGTVINGVTITVLSKRTKGDENQFYNIFVRFLSRTSKIENIFSDCKIVRYKIFPHFKSTALQALLYLEDEDSIQKALEKNESEHDGTTITVKRRYSSVFVTGLTKSIKLDEFFSNCKIHNYKLHKQRDTGNFNGKANVQFADIQSYENALAKNGTEVEGRTISVEPFRHLEYRNNDENRNNDDTIITFQRTVHSVFVKGLTKSIKLDKLFSNCKIHSYTLHKERYTGNFNGKAYVHFADIQSYENALAKNCTVVEGRALSVYPFRQQENRNKNINNDTAKKKFDMTSKKPRVFIKGLPKKNINLQEIFPDCKILKQYLHTNTENGKYFGSANITFVDHQSYLKALEKNGTKINGKGKPISVGSRAKVLNAKKKK